MSVRKIARMAGVSAGAVSMALNGSPKISESTKRRIRRVAADLDYKPNAKVTALMGYVRASGKRRLADCFGVISLYDHPRPWENSEHLKRIHDSMTRRAAELGHRLEALWLKAPGMNLRRFRGVLDARGIQGLLCFGSPGLDDHFPAELDHYAIVTVGMSIQSALHRVTSHFYNDTFHVLEKVFEFGYRRPGLVVGLQEEVRSTYMHSSAYHGWCERTLQRNTAIPVLRLNAMEERPLLAWFKRHQPDVIIFVHHHEALEAFGRLVLGPQPFLPKRVGIAAISQYLEGTSFSGMQQNQELIGSWAVELLLGRVVHRDLGQPTSPRIEMVESHWVEGTTLPRRKPAV